MNNNFKLSLAFASKRKKLDALDGLPKFSWNEIKSQEVIGQGSFGAVFVNRYKATAKPAEKVLVKKLLSTASDFTEMFAKEASILNGLEHENIVSFKAVCTEPVAMMMKYVYFDLEIFGGVGKVSSLNDFVRCLDQNDCHGIGANLMTKISVHDLSGLKYLHEKDVAHRDLKPANVLVSNHHYREEKDRHKLTLGQRASHLYT